MLWYHLICHAPSPPLWSDSGTPTDRRTDRVFPARGQSLPCTFKASQSIQVQEVPNRNNFQQRLHKEGIKQHNTSYVITIIHLIILHRIFHYIDSQLPNIQSISKHNITTSILFFSFLIPLRSRLRVLLSGLCGRALTTELRPFLAPPRRSRVNLYPQKQQHGGETIVHSRQWVQPPKWKARLIGPRRHCNHVSPKTSTDIYIIM